MGTIRRFDLREIIEKTGAKYFVETGTLHGDGVDYALWFNFEKIISIEIIPELAEKAKQKYKNHNNIEIIEGDSSEVIESIANSLDGNTIFWLDAHFPGCDSEHKTYDDIKKLNYDTNLPLKKEIDVLSKRISKYKDTLVCDDLWVYEDVTSGGLIDFDTHCKSCNHNITLDEINPEGNLNFVTERFSNSHEFKKVYRDQGYLVVLPK